MNGPHPRRRVSTPFIRPVVLALLLLASSAPARPSRGQIIEEPTLDLRVECLLLGGGTTRSLAAGPGQVGRGTPGRVTFDLQWPEAARPSRLEVLAALTGSLESWPVPVAVEARLTLLDGRIVTAARTVELGEGTSSLLEVWSRGPERLVLVISGERARRAALRQAPRVSRAVRFHLVIEGVVGERTVPLETNELDTFLGETVEYSFRRGAGDAIESVELRLTPVRIEGDIAEIEAEVTGRLPASGAPLVLGHQQRLVASRGAASALTVAAGEPAKGYRFLVTPNW